MLTIRRSAANSKSKKDENRRQNSFAPSKKFVHVDFEQWVVIGQQGDDSALYTGVYRRRFTLEWCGADGGDGTTAARREVVFVLPQFSTCSESASAVRSSSN